MEIVLTGHAHEQMALRGIEDEQVIKAIKRGSKTKQTYGQLSVYGCLAVAYIIKNNKFVIKTVMIV